MTKEELRATRLSLGMDRTTLAAYLGVSFWTIAQWETGRRAIGMDPITLRIALAAARRAKDAGRALPDWRQSAITPDMHILVAGEPLEEKEV